MSLAFPSRRISRFFSGAFFTWFALLIIAIFIAGWIGRKNAKSEKLHRAKIVHILDDTWEDLNKLGILHTEYQTASVIPVLEKNIGPRESIGDFYVLQAKSEDDPFIIYKKSNLGYTVILFRGGHHTFAFKQ